MLASLRAWGIRFVLGGHTFTIAPRTASDWLEVIVSGTVADLLDDDEMERLTHIASTDDISGELDRVFADVVAEATGREWQVGTRLAALLMQDDLRGEVLTQIDPATRPLAAVLDVVYATIVRWKGKDERAQFDAMLFAPPDSAPGESDPRERARQMRERSKKLLAEREATAEPAGASDMPSSGTPATST